MRTSLLFHSSNCHDPCHMTISHPSVLYLAYALDSFIHHHFYNIITSTLYCIVIDSWQMSVSMSMSQAVRLAQCVKNSKSLTRTHECEYVLGAPRLSKTLNLPHSWVPHSTRGKPNLIQSILMHNFFTCNFPAHFWNALIVFNIQKKSEIQIITTHYK